MRLLILHPNFPAQFKEPAEIAVNLGWEVKFLCQTHYGRSIKNVQRLRLKGSDGRDRLDESKAKGFNRSQVLAEKYFRACKTLEQRGYKPDIILSHSGWGCGLFVKEIWPSSKLISYAEWWFSKNSDLLSEEYQTEWLKFNEETCVELWKKNQTISLELSCSDKIVSPTEWQRTQFPKILRKNTIIIKETPQQDVKDASNMEKVTGKWFHITYGTRGLEAMRCFGEFIEEVPDILEISEKIKITIAGDDQIYYGGNKPRLGSKEVTWKTWAKEKLRSFIDEGRVQFLGPLSRDLYIKWLHRSDLHIYLTQPFVASWSLMDAIELRKKIIASDVQTVREFSHYENLTLVDHRVRGELAQGVRALLESRVGSDSLRVVPSSAVGRAADEVPKTLIKTWKSVLVEDVHTGI